MHAFNSNTIDVVNIHDVEDIAVLRVGHGIVLSPQNPLILLLVHIYSSGPCR
jgi:hypothetical protein